MDSISQAAANIISGLTYDRFLHKILKELFSITSLETYAIPNALRYTLELVSGVLSFGSRGQRSRVAHLAAAGSVRSCAVA